MWTTRLSSALLMALHPDRPFAPKRFPFFYGWWILVVGTLGILASIPGQTMGVSVFADPLLEATGLSRLELSNAYLVGTIASGLLLPLAGGLLDRLGARGLTMLACLALGATLLCFSRIDRAIERLTSLLDLSSTHLVAVVVLTFGFACLRLSGQGLLTMSSRAMVSKWFDRRRGFASGLIGVFINFGFSLAPVVLLARITESGWRGAWIEMAVVISIGMTAIAYVFFRDNPEECGLRMDGAPVPVAADGNPPPIDPIEESMTRSEALRTGVFWMVTLALCVQSMVFTGVTFHIVDIGADGGLTRAAAVALFIPIAFIGVPMGFVVGAAADRISLRLLVIVMSMCQILGFVGVAFIGHPGFRIAAIVGWGLSQGFFGPLTTVAIPKLFGRKHLGAIAGIQMSCLVIGSALGPAALAASKQGMGRYAFGMLACCLLAAIPFVLAVIARVPSPRADVA